MIGVATLGRRALLRVMVLGISGLLLFRRNDDAEARRALELAAKRLVPDRRSAETVGVAYLRAEPPEARRVKSGELQRDLLPAQAGDEVVAALEAKVRRDFREGEVVWVRGFLLSRTEARLCAWIALG